MILEHSSFLKPKNPNQKIWRYVDFTKFIDLLNSESLYFTRVDKFEDIFEGSVPIKTAETRRIPIHQKFINGIKTDVFQDPEIYREYLKQNRQDFGINCWHMNDYESAAMWKIYVKSNEGIAIQSNFKKLNKVLKNSEFEFFIGTVNYIDYEKDNIKFENDFSPFVHKRKSFSHENELRAILPIEAPANVNKIDLQNGGCKIKINLNDLIDNVFISPDSPKWLFELVSETCKKFGFDFNVVNSNLNDNPIY
ncbi:DUF2971 domain-containing protein [Flavobacterium dankookense]|uniref:DUF2971 family protein n=1 Tax=Flavobacterium dankookense TaxID=706186 RepID=A0A4R6QEI0_9FLAO|nr:DUF2971 domain-containing protein [Flavobacterium dankookense]TDP60333.1 Protein of unknown function (DUF2971) [Flavobacterium dankookense]